MRVPRIYQQRPLASGETFALETNAANHVGRVLRLREGAPLILFNGEGGQFQATVSHSERRRVEVTLGSFESIENESPLPLTLAQGISKGERMDYTIQKAVELGVSRIVPLRTERSVVNLSADRMARKHDHWQAVIIGACEQCGRNRLPQLEDATDLEEFISRDIDGIGLLLDHRGTPPQQLSLQAATLLIGPEGGLSENERHAASKYGYRPTRLGPRVLRTETAALTAISILQYRFGDLC